MLTSTDGGQTQMLGLIDHDLAQMRFEALLPLLSFLMEAIEQ
ncbi:Uncharacterized protein AC499_0513 [Pseudomonas amygdali pv. lachrymans]|uniref:Uncharacterized protein n=1 Tax=Pseudomonas amygdali pv. lachrymans TaxID=53707 RepID=A0ABR5KS01_PSEAV|nr:Uncharacterized protein AC499_0513 [Pseudomonas amygdali pv. lachrymans]RMT06423.1 hypothetical protein ALP54_102761 [Pseudomonas amygdali pv. lachrymans]